MRQRLDHGPTCPAALAETAGWGSQVLHRAVGM